MPGQPSVTAPNESRCGSASAAPEFQAVDDVAVGSAADQLDQLVPPLPMRFGNDFEHVAVLAYGDLVGPPICVPQDEAANVRASAAVDEDGRIGDRADAKWRHGPVLGRARAGADGDAAGALCGPALASFARPVDAQFEGADTGGPWR